MSSDEYQFVRRFVWLAVRSRFRRTHNFQERLRRGMATLCHMTAFPGALEFRHVFIVPKPTVSASTLRCLLSTASIQSTPYENPNTFRTSLRNEPSVVIPGDSRVVSCVDSQIC